MKLKFFALVFLVQFLSISASMITSNQQDEGVVLLYKKTLDDTHYFTLYNSMDNVEISFHAYSKLEPVCILQTKGPNGWENAHINQYCFTGTRLIKVLPGKHQPLTVKNDTLSNFRIGISYNKEGSSKISQVWSKEINLELK